MNQKISNKILCGESKLVKLFNYARNWVRRHKPENFFRDDYSYDVPKYEFYVIVR